MTARAVEHRDHVGVAAFFANLVAQQIPGDTLAERGVRGSAVRLLTAHRSKGLEWELVVVAHVQQEGWPDLRRRSSLLGADRIGLDPLGRSRPGAAGHRPGAADGGAPTLLRRLHPRPQTARRHRGEVDRRRGRAAVPVPGRARDQSRAPRRTAAAAAVAGRARRRAAADRRRPGHLAAAAGGRGPAPGRARRSRRSAVARSCRRQTRRRGGAPARRRGPASRCATRSDRSRSRRACSRR